MISFPNLTERLKLCNISQDELAVSLNLSQDVLELKMRGIIPWKLVDAIKICHLLHTDDVKNLFVQLDSK